MPITDIDIYRAAQVLIDQYPLEARNIALKRALAFKRDSDQEGQFLWKRIAQAVDWLQMTGVPKAKTCH